jgi:hypothetical protein
VAAGEEVAASEYRALPHQVREVQRRLGKKTLENEILREALDLAQPKTAVARALAGAGRHAVKAIAEALGGALEPHRPNDGSCASSPAWVPAEPWRTPALLNIFKGEMSLIGPRPHATAMKAGNRLYGEAVGVKPGLTGWAQVNGLRGEIDTPKKARARVEYDLFYIEQRSLWLDLKTLALTIPAVLLRQSA